MTTYRVRYTPEAVGRIRNLHPEVKQEIREAIRTLEDYPLTGHTLQQELAGFRFYRVRTYRIIYPKNGSWPSRSPSTAAEASALRSGSSEVFGLTG
ncbi:MAG: type II toxin-antitoxin system RelE/ParE family toxin [Nitrospirales bacterium]|nr:type II toxin-antitoxin system RelE/ParE family toxin [Nitrospirales bacterium]